MQGLYCCNLHFLIVLGSLPRGWLLLSDLDVGLLTWQVVSNLPFGKPFWLCVNANWPDYKILETMKMEKKK